MVDQSIYRKARHATDDVNPRLPVTAERADRIWSCLTRKNTAESSHGATPRISLKNANLTTCIARGYSRKINPKPSLLSSPLETPEHPPRARLCKASTFAMRVEAELRNFIATWQRYAEIASRYGIGLQGLHGSEERLLRLIDKAIDKEEIGNMGAILLVGEGSCHRLRGKWWSNYGVARELPLVNKRMWQKTTELLLLLAVVRSSEVEWCSPKCICPSQKEVYCHSGGFSEIPAHLLPSLVEHLSFMKNNFTVIKPDAFALLKNLRKLILDGNNISAIRAFAFRGVPRLEELYINNTNLSALSPFSFAGLLGLRNLYLTNNLITSVGRNAFAGTSNIETINLSSNPLVRINSSAFSVSLCYLYAVVPYLMPLEPFFNLPLMVITPHPLLPPIASGIHSSPLKIRWKLKRLQSFGLRHVRYLILPSGIKYIEPEAFAGMDTIGLIKLPYMDLSSLRANTFHGLSNVYAITIQDSDLGVIQPRAFANLSFVGLISLSNNKIDSIRELAILDSQNIDAVKLEGNHILDVPQPHLIVLDVMKEVVVSKNHFPCDCRIHWLLASPLVAGNLTLFLQENFCISPLEFNGKPMSSLDLQSIGGCNDDASVLNRNSAVGRPSGDCWLSLAVGAIVVGRFSRHSFRVS
ncbi:unnamed protein product [Bemisia tabaci]|uniref:Uncharacterized protein n=1 Tax=Bemisia tabaci TaxID=7038 RepID=A0A9P0F7W7_BEMTA|nr:unnamed protein product [Bemisia tabaci]